MTAERIQRNIARVRLGQTFALAIYILESAGSSSKAAIEENRCLKQKKFAGPAVFFVNHRKYKFE